MERKIKIVNGSIVVKNPFAWELPRTTITIKSGKTTYRFTGRYDGVHSVPAKILRLMKKGGENDSEKPGKA